MKNYMVTVTAIQWTGDNLEEVKVIVGDGTAWVAPDGYLDTTYYHAPPNYWLVRLGSSKSVVAVVSPEDFQRDFKEVTE